MKEAPSTYIPSPTQPSRPAQHLHKSITDFHTLAQYHMKLAQILQKHNQLQCCIILCDWALTSMLKALYMKENNSFFPPGFLSMTDLLHLLHTETNPGLDLVVFIGTTQFLSSQLETSLLQKMKYKDVSRLLRRTDDILCQLSSRVISDLSQTYQSIF
ncbi:hypothetical protein ASL14_02760 [Paenibacillus sp. IHB B 3084]|uniref:hypothetical protein n=2 Tax=Paenibacillus TaxID=44249 RepID=UPI00071F8B4C|nr:hypothetical protein [Paenibacillus sp. IHB B 3084]ALP35261.1 hypothetical protein ASL14_02760 [Paenibacillus sp. IHB B 3084]